jgi:hypothetical protein
MMTKLRSLVGSRTFALFAFFWILFGATTCVTNLRDYNLQQMGPDALVRYHTFTLGHSQVPDLQPRGDVVSVNGRTLAAKQPGQAVWGAIPYWFLSHLGIHYEKNYDLASALVTWLSAGLWAALALALLDRMARRFWGFSDAASLVATLAVGAASTVLAYAGIAHHDVLAGALLLFALYAQEADHARGAARSLWLRAATGVLLGLVVFTSMLPALIVAVIGLSVLWSRSLKALLVEALGFALGIAPLLAYNAWYFGSPWVPANVAGGYSDTFASPSWQRCLHHLNAYLGNGGISLWKYAPLAALGAIGMLVLPKRLRRLRWTLGIALLAHLAYLLSIETLGTCSYGPRYLLPAILLLAPGVAAAFDWRAETPSPGRLLLSGALLGYGFSVNLVGALVGSIHCNLDEFPLWYLGQRLGHLSRDAAPLAPAMAVLALCAFGLHAWGRRAKSNVAAAVGPVTERPEGEGEQVDAFDA